MARVLVVEDEPDLLELLEAALKSGGYDVDISDTGRDGLSRARRCLPDLVVLDLMLPDMDGTDVCRVLRSEAATQKTPILILSARNDLSDRIAAFQQGADDYLTKPFSFRELLLRIQAILRRANGNAPQAQQRRRV
jgi:DNA-binding response OmpR family regulator